MLDKKYILKTLKEKRDTVDGIERQSIDHKICRLEKDLKSTEQHWMISTSKLYTTDRIKLKIKKEENLIDGYEKIMIGDKYLHETLKSRIEFGKLKIMYYEKELHYNESLLSKVELNQKTNGCANLQILECSFDPIFEISSLSVYTDLKLQLRNSLNIKDTFDISFEDSTETEIFLMGSDNIVLGAIMIPCEYFVNKLDAIIEMNFRNFNFVKFKISFKKDIRLIRKNALITCAYKYGHGLDNILILSPTICGVCGKFLPLFFHSHRCFRCNFTCHKKCTHVILFQCKNSVGTKHSVVYTNKYNIEHTLKRVELSGFRYCNHCGEIIKTKSGCICIECASSFHINCEKFIFASCKMYSELRNKMADFKPKKYNFDNEQKTRIDDFEILRTIGKGSFAKVVLGKYKDTDKLVALKVLRKSKNSKLLNPRYVETERRVLELATQVDHPFLVHQYFCFQDKYKLYFGLEYLPYGDLFYYVSNGFLDHSIIKLYACEILVGLEFLHKQLFIYRDLKLDNILVCSDGHIKLCDFGLCKGNIDDTSRTDTICGTVDTISPEIIRNESYTNVVDWWSYGVVLYEMYTIHPPFNGATNRQIAWSITHEVPVYPDSIPKLAVQLISKLLNKDPTKRLGYGQNGIDNIKDQAFFDNINWNEIYEKKDNPKFKPELVTVRDKCDSESASEYFFDEDVSHDSCFKNFK